MRLHNSHLMCSLVDLGIVALRGLRLLFALMMKLLLRLMRFWLAQIARLKLVSLLLSLAFASVWVEKLAVF